MTQLPIDWSAAQSRDFDSRQRARLHELCDELGVGLAVRFALQDELTADLATAARAYFVGSHGWIEETDDRVAFICWGRRPC